MGDNRDDSADSRVEVQDGGLGVVPVENIGGRAEFITFSLAGSNTLFNPASWFSALRARAGVSLRPDQDSIRSHIFKGRSGWTIARRRRGLCSAWNPDRRGWMMRWSGTASSGRP